MERGRYTSIGQNIKERVNKLSTKIVITPENIAHVVHPIANYVHKERPDYILAFDRGGRILGLATHILYRELYGQLPTRDKRINFRKVSRKAQRDQIREQFQSDVTKMLSETNSPRVLLLDDWVLTGETKNMAKRIITDISEGRAKISFGVMRGKGKGIRIKDEEAEISGDKKSFAYYSWRNKSDLLGIDYYDSLTPHTVTSPKTIYFRKRIVKNIKNYTAKIKGSTQ